MKPNVLHLLALLPLLLAGFTPPGPEIEDGYYRDPEALTRKWFVDPEVTFHTPGAPAQRWSEVDEAYRFIEELAAAHESLSVREVGESLQGIPIKALFHTVDRPDALTVLIQARVHGNEPATTEGALELAYQLAHGDLADIGINLIILPVLNPEGARDMRRRTRTDIDPNRDYILHHSGSIRAVYRLMRDYDPEVVLDMHEHRAYAWPYDLMVIGPNNPNIPAPVRNFTADVMIGAMEDAFSAAGLRIGPYRLLDFPEDGIRVRESATTFVSEKNALALAGRISLLTEGRGIGLGTQHFGRRTLVQYTAARAVVESAARHEDEIRQRVADSRKAIAAGMEDWILRVDPLKVPAEHQLLNMETLEAEPTSTTYWDRTNGTVSAMLEVPEAYVVRADQTDLMDRLRRFGLELIPVAKPTRMEVEVLTVEAFEPGSDILYGGALQREDGVPVRPAVLRNHDVTLQTVSEERPIPAGSHIIPTRQANALYLLTLEPVCLSGYAALGYWGDAISPGFEFPVYRLRQLPGSMDQGMSDDHGHNPAQHRD